MDVSILLFKILPGYSRKIRLLKGFQHFGFNLHVPEFLSAIFY